MKDFGLPESAMYLQRPIRFEEDVDQEDRVARLEGDRQEAARMVCSAAESLELSK